MLLKISNRRWMQSEGEDTMLTIKVNGHVKKLNIGCRTFVALDVLLKTIGSNPQKVMLNGEGVMSDMFAETTVKGDDALVLA
jgi:hypothetical protein